MSSQSTAWKPTNGDKDMAYAPKRETAKAPGSPAEAARIEAGEAAEWTAEMSDAAVEEKLRDAMREHAERVSALPEEFFDRIRVPSWFGSIARLAMDPAVRRAVKDIIEAGRVIWERLRPTVMEAVVEGGEADG